MNKADSNYVKDETKAIKEQEKGHDKVADIVGEKAEVKAKNRDPITDAPGSHPVGTGVGKLGGAVARWQAQRLVNLRATWAPRLAAWWVPSLVQPLGTVLARRSIRPLKKRIGAAHTARNRTSTPSTPSMTTHLPIAPASWAAMSTAIFPGTRQNPAWPRHGKSRKVRPAFNGTRRVMLRVPHGSAQRSPDPEFDPSVACGTDGHDFVPIALTEICTNRLSFRLGFHRPRSLDARRHFLYSPATRVECRRQDPFAAGAMRRQRIA